MTTERTHPRVLVVDDDAAVREAIQPVLEGAGYKVVLAGNGQEAVARFSAEGFDLVVLDLSLPLLGGWDVFERVTTRCPLMPVIVITGMPDQLQTALAAGVGALIEKPVDVSTLLRTMDDLLSEPKEKRLLRLCGNLNDTRHVGATDIPRGKGDPHAEMPKMAVEGAISRGNGKKSKKAEI